MATAAPVLEGAFHSAMSERSIPSQSENSVPAAQEQQSRFIADNLRRVFLLIYRIVNNVADAQDLTQEAFLHKYNSDLANDIGNLSHRATSRRRRFALDTVTISSASFRWDSPTLPPPSCAP